MKKNRILQTGRNCWRIRRADKVAFIVDGADYFSALYKSFPLAQQQIMLLAWDIHSKLNLVPPGEHSDSTHPTALGKLLDYLVRQNPSLHINILSWDFSLLLATSREWLPIYKMEWNTHQRMKFCMDDQYPLGASHHQKLVVIDDMLAYAGGLDLTLGRWDTKAHDPDNPKRAAIDGTSLPIKPHHDVQMAVSGPAASALGDLARERWRRGTNQELVTPSHEKNELWPEGLQVDIEDVDVAIVRTNPQFDDFSEVREVEQLYIDSIAAAEDYIYIENQFFTAPSISGALEKCLSDPDGPEIILNLSLKTDGWLSRNSMDMMRVGLIRRLRKADKYGRFSACYPYKKGMKGESINLHAKVMIMDDRFIRVGSANLNNRSMGLDTECDLAIEAGHGDEHVEKAIRHFRNELISEHLDCEPAEFDRAVEQRGSLLKAIKTLSGGSRDLRDLESKLAEPDDRLLEDIRFTDPEQPLDSNKLLNHFVPEKQARSAGQRIAGWSLTLIVILALAAAWRFTALNEWLDINRLSEIATVWRESSLTPLIVITAFVLGGLLVMPVTAMIITSVVVFGPWLGFVYALLGSFVSALSGYGLGSLLGKKTIRKLAGKRINQVSRQLAKRGVLTMVVVRIVPVAPFTIINLIAGGSHIRFRDFVIGTLVGMTPGVLGVTLLTDRVQATLRTPDWGTLLTLIISAVTVFVGGYLLSKTLLKKEVSKKVDKQSP